MNFAKVVELLKDCDLDKVAKKSGLSQSRLQLLQSGEEPTVADLRALAAAFKVELRDLLPSTDNEKSVAMLFRQSSTTKEANVAPLVRKIEYSLDLAEQKLTAGPWWLGRFTRDSKTFEQAEQNARQFRQLFYGGDQFGPFLSLPRTVVDAAGIFLFVVRSNEFDGASAYVNSLPFIFVAERNGPRMLFTLAHELGHLLAHHDPVAGFATLDREAEKLVTKGKNLDEFYAHSFASCLLMPSEGVLFTLKKIRSMQKEVNSELGDLEILLLSQIYGVSFYVAARRCEDLQLLPRGGAASLNETLTNEYGSAEKRAKDAGLPDRPTIRFPRVPAALLESVIEKIRDGEVSIGRASQLVGLSIAELLSADGATVH